MGFFDKMFSGLTKTRKNIEDLEEVFRNYDIDSEDFYDELEEMLIMADVGGETTAQIMMDYKRILLRRYIGIVFILLFQRHNHSDFIALKIC